MLYYVSAQAAGNGDGSAGAPFKAIGQAAGVARPGDEVIVGPGIYREYVDPQNGGAENERIVYRAQPAGQAVITGAEVVKGWTDCGKGVWLARVPNTLFGTYNPYTTLVRGDWYFGDVPLHTGEVYVNGRAMYEMPSLEAVRAPRRCAASWEPAEETLYQWYTEQAEGCTCIYANFRGLDPNRETVEINVRRSCFLPSRTGVGYITLAGFVIRQAATTWAPPTAYQDGMVGPHWSKGWIIENCELHDAKCCAISLGKYLQPGNENKWTEKRFKHGTQTEREVVCRAQSEGWNRETVGSHLVRRCHIHHCGQAGIVGHLGGVFSVIEDNHVHHVNTKQQLLGAEVAGIKMHAAIDTVFRRNHIHHCTRGMWLDWQAQGTRVSQSLFHDNTPPDGVRIPNADALGEDLFIEVSHGPTLVDNNVFLSCHAARLSTQGVAFVHNLIGGSFTYVGAGTDHGPGTGQRYTPYHVPHGTDVAGFMTILHGDDRFYNNIFIQLAAPGRYRAFCEQAGISVNSAVGTAPFDAYPTCEEYEQAFFGGRADGRNRYYTELPVWTGGNVFVNGARPCAKEVSPCVPAAAAALALTEKDGAYFIETDLYALLARGGTEQISTDTLGEAFEPEQRFEAPDGSPILFNEDYRGVSRGAAPVPGPFEVERDARIRVW